MPLLDVDLIQDCDELRRAYVLLGMILQSYCKKTKCTTVHRQLAVPWTKICKERLDLPLVIVAAGTDLWNVGKIDSKRPLRLEDNMRLITSMTGTISESFFHLTATSMHVAFAKLLPSLVELPYAMRKENEYETAKILNKTKTFFDEIRTLFKRGKKRIDKSEFYDTYRPLLGGYEKGLILEGTNEMLIGNGPSGGQSSMFVMLDAVLGIVHQGHSRSFQDDAYKAMPSPHRRFVRDFVNTVHHETGNMTDFMQRKIRGSACNDAYRTCLESYESFRKYHLGIATRYLSSTTKGTGNSTFRSLLKEFKMNTEKCRRNIYGSK